MLRNLLIVLAVLAAALGAWHFGQQPHYLPTVEASQFRNYWSGELRAHGAAAVMDRLQREFARDEPDEQHYAVHIMGEILFKENGLDGIRDCSALYGYGCYHGFFTAAISSLGESSVPDLDGICLSLGGGLTTESCQHGVGHGILEYIGPQRLELALQWCAQKVQDVFPALGCKSGVFMEYFNPQLEPDRRPEFDPREPLNICRDLPVAVQRTCVYELPVLWRKADLPPMAVDAACASLSDVRAEESCYIGYGNFIAPESGFSIDAAGAECDQMSPRGAALCRAGVAWSLSQEDQRDRMALSCEPLSPDLRSLCLEKSSFACSLAGTCQ